MVRKYRTTISWIGKDGEENNRTARDRLKRMKGRCRMLLIFFRLSNIAVEAFVATLRSKDVFHSIFSFLRNVSSGSF